LMAAAATLFAGSLAFVSPLVAHRLDRTCTQVRCVDPLTFGAATAMAVGAAFKLKEFQDEEAEASSQLLEAPVQSATMSVGPISAPSPAPSQPIIATSTLADVATTVVQVGLQPVAPSGFVWADDQEAYATAAATAAAKAYEAKKAIYDERRLVLIPPRGANKPTAETCDSTRQKEAPQEEEGSVQQVGPWPSIGGVTSPHRMAGTMPPPPARETWVPPAGWVPPCKPVRSWYDSGTRLKQPIVSWYDSGKRLTSPSTRAGSVAGINDADDADSRSTAVPKRRRKRDMVKNFLKRVVSRGRD